MNPPERKPAWLKAPLPGGEKYAAVSNILNHLQLTTVCLEAKCPNRGECWNAGTATFMVLGDVCTRGCRFCAVKTSLKGNPLDTKEPERIAEAAKKLGLSYVVLTSVTRDDLPDGGAEHFAACVAAVKKKLPNVPVEALIPDFDENGIKKMLDAKVDVLAHNIEVIQRLTPLVRDPRFCYTKSLETLENAKKNSPNTLTKSSLMLGVGETDEEITAALRDLRAAGCDILVLTQYMQPTPSNLPVKEYVHPEKFEALRKKACDMGFPIVVAHPLARTSYRARESYLSARKL
ncbi:Lipoyl synthase [uncultured archaeon]|nr:Lipoyl synthase [uncultured archaeon]